MWKNGALMSKDIGIPLLSPQTSCHAKKVIFFLTSPRRASTLLLLPPLLYILL